MNHTVITTPPDAMRLPPIHRDIPRYPDTREDVFERRPETLSDEIPF